MRRSNRICEAQSEIHAASEDIMLFGADIPSDQSSSGKTAISSIGNLLFQP